MAREAKTNGAVPDEVEAVVIGAGFGGMYMLHRLRELGISSIAFEAGSDVGGTWYWNQYPGARCDIESLIYNYSWDSELRDEYKYKWPERYSTQPEILKYAQHVADRYDLRRDIFFDSQVSRVAWDEDRRQWQVDTKNGHEVWADFVFSAVGLLSSVQMPAIAGLETFKGETYHTGRWPQEEVSLVGKRVAQIGTGSSGVQAGPEIAQEAAHLTVLQRTAQYSVPNRNHMFTSDLVDASTERIEQLMKIITGPASRTPFWEGHNPKSTFDDNPEEREAYFELLWGMGGIDFFVAYKDTMTDLEANEIASDFVRRKIRSIVNDPEVAERLMPSYPIGAKRMIGDIGYFEMYNRDNVTLEDIRSDPIEKIVPQGIVLESGKLIEVDVIVFATGFDAMTGPIFGLNVQGVDGQTLKDAWAAGPKTFLGLATRRFPNLFFLTGPGSPSTLSVVLLSIEQHVDWLIKLYAYLREHGIDRIEADFVQQEKWVAHCNELANRTLWPRADSWYLGANVPGKPRVFMPYIGGNGLYQEQLNAVEKSGYEGFDLSSNGRPPETA